MQRRIKRFKSDVYRLIAIEDAFGLKPRKPFTFNTRFQFLTSDQKLKSFNAWLANQVKKGILEVEADGKPWTAKYIDSAYKKGRIDAFLKAHKKDYSKPEQWLAGVRDQFLRQAFSQPETVSKLRLLYTRDYQQLKGITADMDSKLSRILATGIVNGTAPAKLASQITKEIDGINKKRASLIAHVNVMSAHAEGQLDSFEDLGIKELGIMAEWSTAGDKRVCPRCNALSGKIFTVKQARGLIPLHPNCVTGDMRIETPSPLSVMRGIFSGRIFEIFTAKGRRLSVTENHVLLTQRGWVKSKFLTKADQLVDASTVGGLSFQTPNDNDYVPTVEENFHSLLEFGEVHSVRSSDTGAEDFHGDSRSFDGKVNIVRSDSFLRDKFQSLFFSQREQNPFVFGNIDSSHSSLLQSECSQTALSIRLAAAASCFMGSRSVASVFFRGSSLHHNLISLPLVSDFDSRFNHSFANDSSRVGKTSAEFWKRNPGLVELDHLIKQFWRNDDAGFAQFFNHRGQSFRGLDVPSFDSMSFKSIADSFRILVSYFFSDLRTTQSALVEFDDVVNIRIRHVTDLPVYDVESQETIYNCNGVITSNCRCTWIPITGRRKPSKLGKRQKKALAA